MERHMPSEPVIRTWDLTKRFGRTLAVDGLTMEAPQGEVFGLLGPNGARKTTTIAMLLGLVRLTAGSAELLGQDIRRGLGPALRFRSRHRVFRVRSHHAARRGKLLGARDAEEDTALEPDRRMVP